MSEEVMYEIVSEGRFEICLEKRTMEDATGVLYTNEDLKALYNAGEEWVDYYDDSRTSYSILCDYKYGPRSLIYLDSLLSHVLGELSNPKKKEVFVDLSDRAISKLAGYMQKCLKQNGVMCRPSTGAFVRFKAKPKKVDVKKSILMRLKSNCVGHLQQLLNREYKIELDFKGLSTEQNLRNYIKFGMKLGQTVDLIMEGQPFYRQWIQNTDVEDYGNGRYEYYPLDWYLTNILFKDSADKEELIKLHKQAFRNWLEEIALL